MNQLRGRLVTLEGVTGAGKSTLCRHIYTLTRHVPSRPLVFGGYFMRGATNGFHRDLLTVIRRQLAVDEFLRIDSRVECLVLQAELLLAENTLVRPALEAGQVVLYEHHLDSIYAYQAARLVEEGTYNSISRAVKHVRAVLLPFATRLIPKTTIFFDVDPDQAAQRAARRDGRRVTRRARAFNRLVAEAYSYVYGDRTARVVRTTTMAEALASAERILGLARAAQPGGDTDRVSRHYRRR